MQTAAMIKRMVQGDRIIECERMGLLFNRVQGNEELLKRSAQEMGLDVFGYVPQDENIAYHDLVGKPIIELPTSPGLVAVRSIVEKCVFRERFGERLGN
jgi:CO dehydrogenase nickel-insertion accessory protein CooC1